MVIILLLLFNVLSTGTTGDALDAITGEEVRIDNLLESNSFIVYIMDSEPCTHCAQDIYNYSLYNKEIRLPMLLVITNATWETLKSGVEDNRNSGTSDLFNRTHYQIPINDKKNVLDKLNLKGEAKIYLIENGEHSCLNEDFIDFIHNYNK